MIQDVHDALVEALGPRVDWLNKSVEDDPTSTLYPRIVLNYDDAHRRDWDCYTEARTLSLFTTAWAREGCCGGQRPYDALCVFLEQVLTTLKQRFGDHVKLRRRRPKRLPAEVQAWAEDWDFVIDYEVQNG